MPNVMYGERVIQSNRPLQLPLCGYTKSVGEPLDLSLVAHLPGCVSTDDRAGTQNTLVDNPRSKGNPGGLVFVQVHRV